MDIIGTPQLVQTPQIKYLPLKENDAFGVRLEGSGWALGFGGIDVNFDFVYFKRSHEFSVFVTPGYEQGAGGGFAVTGGLLFGNNFPNKNAYSGPAWTMAGFDVPFIVSIEGDFPVGTPYPPSAGKTPYKTGNRACRTAGICKTIAAQRSFK